MPFHIRVNKNESAVTWWLRLNLIPADIFMNRSWRQEGLSAKIDLSVLGV